METLTDIWGELRTRVRRFVGNRVNDPHAADDITQDVMLKVQTRLDTLLPDDRLPARTIAVARNAVIDHYRTRAASVSASMVWASGSTSATLAWSWRPEVRRIDLITVFHVRQEPVGLNVTLPAATPSTLKSSGRS